MKRIIHLKGNTTMKDKIEKAAQKAEAEFQQRKEISRGADIDVREVFTADEIDALLRGNGFFAGKTCDLTKVQRYKKLEAAAKWLHANSMEVTDIQIEAISSSHPNVIIVLEIRRLASMRNQELQAFSAMAALADSMFISGIQDSVIRFTFGIEGVWQA